MGPWLRPGTGASRPRKRKKKDEVEAAEEVPQPRPLPVQEEAEVSPHRGVIALDQVAGNPPLLVHLKTLERKPLPAGDWQLDFDDDGFAALTQLDGDQVLFAEDVLHRTLCASPGDKMLVLEGPTGQPKRQWSLSAKLMKYEEVQVKLRGGQDQHRPSTSSPPSS